VSIWNRERVPGIAGRHALGVWLTYRKVASAGYVPGPVSRASLANKLHLDYVFNFALTARLNAEDRIVTSTDFYLVTLIGSSSLPAGFRVQLYDSFARQRLSDPVNFPNYLGDARHPHILRKPYRFCGNQPILVRVQNLDTSGATNNIQIVLGGFGN
jgi:hypothetical protein